MQWGEGGDLYTAAILLTRGAEKGGGGVGRVLYTDVIVYEYAESTNTVDLSDARHQKLFKTSDFLPAGNFPVKPCQCKTKQTDL